MDVLAGEERLPTLLEVEADRRGDADRVHLAVGEQLFDGEKRLWDVEDPRRPLGSAGHRVAHGGHPHAVVDVGLRQVGQDAAERDRSGSDDSQTHRSWHWGAILAEEDPSAPPRPKDLSNRGSRGTTMNKQKTMTALVAALAVAASLAVSAATALAGPTYGPDMCLGCMPPAGAAPVRGDTLNAPLRRNQVRVTLGTYAPRPATCVGAVCAIASDYDARYVVRADQINVGHAAVVLFRRSDDTPIWSTSVQVTPYGTRPGGWVSVRTGILNCVGGANTAPNAYFRVKDGVSGRWSIPQYVTTGCAPL